MLAKPCVMLEYKLIMATESWFTVAIKARPTATHNERVFHEVLALFVPNEPNKEPSIEPTHEFFHHFPFLVLPCRGAVSLSRRAPPA